MATTATINLGLNIKKTLDSNVAGITTPDLNYDKLNTSKALTSSTTPAVSNGSKQSIALSSGAKTIDLTALTDANGASISLSGLKLVAVQIENPAANANNMTFAPGSANGCNFMGASGQVTLSPGQSIEIYNHTGGPTIGSGIKNIDVTGTGSQAFYFGVVAG